MSEPEIRETTIIDPGANPFIDRSHQRNPYLQVLLTPECVGGKLSLDQTRIEDVSFSDGGVASGFCRRWSLERLMARHLRVTAEPLPPLQSPPMLRRT